MTAREGGPPPAQGSGAAPVAGAHPTDLLPSYALGILEPDERDAVAAHVRGCAACAAELRELRGSGQSAAIAGRVLFEANGRNGLAILDHLPPLEPGKVYQLWLLQGATPVSAGTFRSDAAGTGTLVIRAPGPFGGFSGFGLTAEPDPGGAAPTGAILATGAL